MGGTHSAGELHAHGALLWLDPRAKIISLIGVIFVAVSTPPTAWQAFAAYGALLLLYGLAGSVPWLIVARRMVVVVPFVLLVLVFVPFMEPDFSRGQYWVTLWKFRISSHALLVIQNVLMKSAISVFAVALLTSTTNFPDLLRGFQRLKVPTIFVEIVALAWRYIFVLREETTRMLRARDARAWHARFAWQTWALGLMIGTLFLRTYERAERVYHAMQARGYQGQAQARYSRPMARPDWGLILLFAVAAAGIRLWAWKM
jgi:cobalt/nickel transport system permease protein